MANKNNMTLKEILGNTKIFVSRMFYSPGGAFIALGAGLVAQLLLENKKIFFALVLYFYAAISFVVSTQNVKLPEFHLAFAKKQKDDLRYKSGLIAGVLAVILAVLSFIQFDNNNPVLAPWVLYIMSMLLLVLSAYLLDGADKDVLNKKKKLISTEHIILLAILSLAFFLRIYKLDQIPFGLWYDEADNGLSALRLLNDPGYFPLFAESTNLPPHFIYLDALTIKLFGASAFALRLVSVIFGVATVGAGYFAGKQLLGPRSALIFAFLLSISRWDINWSRIAMHGVTVPFFELLTIGFILLALKRNRLLDFAFAGLAIGLGLGFYVPLRIFPVVIILIFLFLVIKQRNIFKIYKSGLSVIVLAMIVASIPVTKYALTNSETFFSRTKMTSIFTSKATEEALKAVVETTREHLLMFNYQGDRNGRHNVPGEPMLDPISGTLMVMGIAFSLNRFRKFIPILLIGWLLIMLAPGIFSLDFESPQSLRAIGSLPAAYLLASVAVVAVLKKGEQGFPLQRRQMLNVILLILLGTAGIFNSLVYFDRQALSFDSWAQFSTRETIIGNKMLEIGGDTEYYISIFYYNSPTIKFLAPNVGQKHELQTYDSFPFRLDGERKAVFFIDSDRKMLFDQAKRYYPDGEFEEIKSPDGKIILYQVVLSPHDIQRIQGLNASYYKDGDLSLDPVITRQETNFSFGFIGHAPLQMPYGLEFTGVLNAYSYGSYRFNINSPGMVELSIDGELIQFDIGDGISEEIILAKGNHAITIRTSAADGNFEFFWQPPGEEWSIITANSLYVDPVTNNGLLGQYYSNEDWQGPPAFKQVDPWINFYYHNLILPRPYTANWSGKIYIQEDGIYTFGLESVDESSLSIDDHQILPFKTRDRYEEESIELISGYHDIEVLFSDHTGYSFINLFWTPPDSKREIIPQEVLFYTKNN